MHAIALALILVPSLPADTRRILDAADGVELISLDPKRIDAEAKDQGFHGYKPLGKTSLKRKADRAKLLKALYKGIDDSDGTVAGCFNPSHGIRAKSGGKTVELVICYQCCSMTVHLDGKASGVLTTPSPSKLFNSILADAKVPLPKQAE
ncbi:MAG: hypothetical protein K2W96_23085 [Gemmataceae bacterium]|nr:hypothetical protein [Gemmataceae bacterium]